jgi:hypothetical protein
MRQSSRKIRTLDGLLIYVRRALRAFDTDSKFEKIARFNILIYNIRTT